MAQIQKRFIATAAVDGTKIQLDNAQSLVALNASASPTNLLQLDGSNHLLIQTQIDMNTLAIKNMANPSAAQDATTKSYVDSLVQGLDWKQLVVSATTAALPTYTYLAGVITETSNGALPAQDGVTLSNGDRLLVKDETSGNAPYNGIYVVTDVGSAGTPFILTRSDDANTAVLLQNATVAVGDGASTQAGMIFYESAVIATLGTDPVTFTNIFAALSYTFADGLTVTGSVVSVLASDASIAVAVGGISVQEDPAGAITTTGSGVKVAVDGSTMDISGNQLIVKSAGITATQLAAASVTENAIASSALSATGALTGGSGTKLAVAVDNSTIAISTDQLIVKSAGITETQIASSALSASGALTGGSGTKLSVAVDGSTVKITTDALQAAVVKVDNLTLNGTDITNQYKDLSFAIQGTGSVFLSVIGGPIQAFGTDYTVSATGGSGGVGRITFAGDLATGGPAALVSGDILVVSYEHF